MRQRTFLMDFAHQSCGLHDKPFNRQDIAVSVQ